MNKSSSRAILPLKTSALTLGVLAFYHRDLLILANEALRSELMSHILTIPFLFIYLIYRRRRVLRAAVSFPQERKRTRTMWTHEAVGALLCLLAFLFYWHGSYTFNPLEHHVASIPIFTAGLILVLFNYETLRALAFPIFFLIFLVPPPLEAIYAAGTILSTISSEAAYTILKGMGLHVSLSSQYETPVITLMKPEQTPMSFAIDISCAGLYSLMGFTIFAVFVAYIARGALWRKLAIFLTGFPLIYALNITRIVTIVLIGAASGIETAMQIFHIMGGWMLIFIGTFILLSISERAFKIQLFTKKNPQGICKFCDKKLDDEEYFCFACGRILKPWANRLSGGDICKMILLALASVIILNMQVPVFAITEGPAKVNIKTLGGQETATQILPEIPGYNLRFIYRDRRFEQIAKQDAALTYAYIPKGDSKRTVWATVEIAPSRSNLHRWEVCLVTWPLAHGGRPSVTQLSLRDVQILQNPPLYARFFAFQRKQRNITQVVLYWYENAFFNIGQRIENRYVKISLIAFADNPQEIIVLEDKLVPFARSIVSYWEPLKSWSHMALIISQNGIILMGMTLFLTVFVLTYGLIKKEMKKKTNLRIYNRLSSEEDKAVLKAVRQAEKELSTGNRIIDEYKRITDKPINMESLLQKLKVAEDAGLVKKEIVSREDEPMIEWKIQFILKAIK